jgi:apolipoprotein N-acyltransferase
VLGFAALVPWLLTLSAERTFAGTLLSAWAMAVAFSAAVFAWFGSAIGAYTGVGATTGLVVLLVGAPLFQPQFLAFAVVRRLAGRRHGVVLRALAGAAAWVATEGLVPRLLGDTLGDGLYPSRLLRQAADVGGAAGLTVLLLLANEAVAAAIARRGAGLRALAAPVALAACVPVLLAGYGHVALSRPPADAGPPLRMGLVQSGIVDYERLRREIGPSAVVREVLDTHFAMSYDAIEHHHADAVLWSETVYPTTFGHPKSEAGAAFDREILDAVDAAGVPFVFGTYDRDAAGEYNAAAFVTPGSGLLGFYRKTRPFPLTEYVPAWLDGPELRQRLPWAGSWQPGTGARVFPLRLKDGREIPVQPLICLDDADAGLAIDGARLGARAILTLSNDSWFTMDAQGAALHQAVAAFRSIETRLPQFRVTTNGFSAVIDATGTVVAGTRMGERTLVIGDVPVPEPRRTLMVAWGDWVARAAAAFLALLAAAAALRAWGRSSAKEAAPAADAPALPADVAVLTPVARLGAGLLRAFSRASLLGMGAAILLGDGALQSNTLAQIRTFVALFLVPEAAAWCVLRAYAARATLDAGAFVLTRGRCRLTLPLAQIAAVEAWRVPIPGPGASLRLASGRRWPFGIAHADPARLARALAPEGNAPAGQRDGAQRPPSTGLSARAALYAHVRSAIRRGRADHPLAKFVLFPLALAIPAFRLHQHIAYGSAFGEYYSFGLAAYLVSFVLWWAAWAIGVVLCAAALRATIETATLAAIFLQPAQAIGARRVLERLGRIALYLGFPAWLMLRVFAG